MPFNYVWAIYILYFTIYNAHYAYYPSNIIRLKRIFLITVGYRPQILGSVTLAV